MAIGSFYDPNPRDAYEREMHYRRQEEEYRRQQYAYYNAGQQPAMIGQEMAKAVPKPDPKDPLAFLNKADSKLLLTGEAS